MTTVEESHYIPPKDPLFTSTRNYTSEDEKYQWWQLKFRTCQRKYRTGSHSNGDDSEKENFRTRRSYWWGEKQSIKKALRIRIGNSDQVGAFTRLTNSYFLVGGEQESEIFHRTVEGDLPDIPVIKTSLAGCRVIGRMCVGNKHGLIVPETTYDTEIKCLEEKLPDSVEVRKVEERLSALGNVIVCNDNVALVHPDLDKETEEIIANTLQVEIFRQLLAGSPLVGTYCVLSNQGGLVSPSSNNSTLENVSSLIQLPLFSGTVNTGDKAVASGLVVNDSIVYAGMKTTSNEFSVIEKAFRCDEGYYSTYLG